MTTIIRIMKILSYIPFAFITIGLIFFVLLVVFPINYIIKGPNNYQDSSIADFTNRLGHIMDNWFKE